MKKVLSIFLCVFLICNVSAFANSEDKSEVIVYPAPDGEPTNDDFVLRVRKTGEQWIDVPIYNVVVSDGSIVEGVTSHQKNASVAYFDFSGLVEVEVIYNKSSAENFRVRPDSENINYERNGNGIKFSLTEPKKLVVQVDDNDKEQLHIFANPIEIYDVNKNAENVWYFGAGVHTSENNKHIKTVNEGLDYDVVVIPSNTTVFIDGGAVVHATFIFADEVGESVFEVKKGSVNSKIIGHGIISGLWHTSSDGILASSYMRKEGHGSPCGIYVKNCENITLDGFIYLNPGQYCLCNVNTNNYTVNNVKIFDCMIWGDGINSYCCNNVTITDCFVRAADDCIPIYAGIGENAGKGSSNIEISKCILYCDNGHCIFVGRHGSQDDNNKAVIEKINCHDCYLLDAYVTSEGYYGTMAVEAGDSNIIRNINFENIIVEDFANSSLFKIDVSKNGYNPIAGYLVENVSFKNIEYEGKNKNPSLIYGYSNDRVVNNISFENLTINGKPIVDAKEGNIKVHNYAYNVSFKYDGIDGIFHAKSQTEQEKQLEKYSPKSADVIIIKPQNDIVIDGNGDDWKSIEEIDLVKLGSNTIPPNQYKGEKDFSAKMKITYDENNLYMLVEVIDDVHFIMEGEALYWEGDSFQVSFNNKDNKYGPGFGFSTEGILFREGAGSEFYKDEELKKVNFKAIQKEGAVTYEIKLPWTSVFDEMPKAGFSVGTLINENDGYGRIGWLEWGSGIANTKATDSFKNVVFEQETQFVDIQDSFACNDIKYLYKMGLISGKDALHFEPEEKLTRAEAITLALRCAGYDGIEYQNVFADVSVKDWYANYIQSAKIKGLIPDRIIDDDCISADNVIKREDFVEILLNTLSYKDISETDEIRDIVNVLQDETVSRDYAATVIAQIYRNIITQDKS